METRPDGYLYDYTTQAEAPVAREAARRAAAEMTQHDPDGRKWTVLHDPGRLADGDLPGYRVIRCREGYDPVRQAPPGAKAVTYSTTLTISEHRAVGRAVRRILDPTGPLNHGDVEALRTAALKLAATTQDRTS